ncbi:MAG: hypothetical protein HOJ15_01075 [Candidatus Jacksonbacteria bacterium]|jgi:hypothetical protein|nr:hypothetical protein [Candidatus Jacksonbacteria bacterium]MBT6034063.1 hypothetical protein [Candidatus Jacksonbacteria bacterium]MBT6301004.1 hypothetical protein [Candidatus Jacksonbacteria bacterium]MBT6757185.1 hypothetical protein [Candidatus Jacksonbacteria bacterium]MBT6954832.1 hypothetical protein [Candidatus Jacksonbacteria bacterium]
MKRSSYTLLTLLGYVFLLPPLVFWLTSVSYVAGYETPFDPLLLNLSFWKGVLITIVSPALSFMISIIGIRKKTQNQGFLVSVLILFDILLIISIIIAAGLRFGRA